MLSVDSIRSLIGVSEFKTTAGERYLLITPFVSQEFGISTSSTSHFISSILFKLDNNNAETCERALNSLLSELSVLGYLIAPDLSNIQSVRYFSSKLGFSAFEHLPIVPVLNKASLVFDEELPMAYRGMIRNYAKIADVTDRFACLSHFSEPANDQEGVVVTESEKGDVSGNGTILLAHENFALDEKGQVIIDRLRDYQLTRIKRFGFANFPARRSLDYFNIIQLNGLSINSSDLYSSVSDSHISSSIIINGNVMYHDVVSNYIASTIKPDQTLITEKELSLLSLCSIKKAGDTFTENTDDLFSFDSLF